MCTYLHVMWILPNECIANFFPFSLGMEKESRQIYCSLSLHKNRLMKNRENDFLLGPAVTGQGQTALK